MPYIMSDVKIMNDVQYQSKKNHNLLSMVVNSA